MKYFEASRRSRLHPAFLCAVLIAWASVPALGKTPTIIVKATPQQEMFYGMDFERLWSWSGLKEKTRLANLAVKECEVQYVRIAIPCESELEEGKFNTSGPLYSKTLDCMRYLHKANPEIRFFASPQPLFVSMGSVPWTCFPLWVQKGKGTEFHPKKAADYLVRNVEFLRKQGFNIAYLDTKNECKFMTPRDIADMVKHIRDQLGVKTPLIVAPSNQKYTEGGAWLAEAKRINETDFFDIISTHDGDWNRGGTPEDFTRPASAFNKPMWNTEMHAWTWRGPDQSAMTFERVLSMIRAGIGGMNDWLSLGNEKKPFKMFRTMNDKSLEVMRSYYIYKKLVNTSGGGNYLETSIPYGVTTTAGFIKDDTMTVWAINGSEEPIDTVIVKLTGHAIADPEIEVTFWGPDNLREGSANQITRTSATQFSSPLAAKTLYCFEFKLNNKTSVQPKTRRAGGLSEAPAKMRTWTSVKGTKLEARLISMRGPVVVLQKPDGKTMTINRRFLSSADQEYLSSRK